MKNLWVLVGVCLVVQLVNYNVQAHPHRSIEDTEEDSSSDSDQSMGAVMPPAYPPPQHKESSNVRGEMTSHEKSHEDEEEDERNTSTSMASPDSQHNSDEDDTVRFPKAESLCPARPEEINNIELECAREYQQWKEMKARKEMTAATTTCEPTVEMVETAPKSAPEDSMSEDMRMSTEDSTVEDASTTTEVTLTTTTEDSEETTTTTTMETEMTTETTTSMRTPTTTTAMMPQKRGSNNHGKKHRRSTVRRKRSCYPATCILKKLKLLDSMGQLNSKQVQKFAVNMTVDDTTNLEQKAVECVKEINDAMIDSSSDIGKKVGCVAQKVITCLNKGLACPIVKVQH